MEKQHIPVLLEEVVSSLDLKPGLTVVDATLGLGGHAEAMLKEIGSKGKLIGVDQDQEARQIAGSRLQQFGDQLVLVDGNFRNLDSLLSGIGYKQVDRILFDLGVSSLQLDTAERGFSFNHDAPLDMRMDQKSRLTAEDLVNDLDEEELTEVIYRLGEESKSRQIASKIVEARKRERISTTAQLVAAVGGPQGRIHPATKTFQALRMVVNDELRVIEEALPQAWKLLKPGGRMAVITFHSLEDRLVKNIFKDLEQDGGRLVNKKVIQASWQEKQKNRRSRSAKLRVIEKYIS